MTARETHWREDLIAALLGALLVAGLFLDGAHHLALAHGQDESLLSPWHLPLFVGFNACAIWTITRNDRLRAMLRGGRPAPGATAAAGPRPALGAAHIALVGLVIAALGTAGPPFGFLVAAGAVIVLGACVHAIVGPIGVDRRVGLAAGCAFALTAGAFGAAGLNQRQHAAAPQTAASGSSSSSSSSVHEHHHAAAAAAPAAAAGAATASAKRAPRKAAHAKRASAAHRAHVSTSASSRHVAAHRSATTTAAP